MKRKNQTSYPRYRPGIVPPVAALIPRTSALDWEMLFTNYEQASEEMDRLMGDPLYVVAKGAYAVAWTDLLTALRAEPGGKVWKGQHYEAGAMPAGHAAAIHSTPVRKGTART